MAKSGFSGKNILINLIVDCIYYFIEVFGLLNI